MSATTDHGKPSLISMLNLRIFLPSALPVVVGIILGFIYKDEFSQVVGSVLGWTLKYFGWFYTMGSTFLLGIALWAAFSRYGSIRLGGPEAKPEMSFVTWFAISLTSVIAIGICFFGVVEPMSHYLNPPSFTGLEPKSTLAGEWAFRFTFLHWTFHPYGIYTAASLCMAVTFYNSKQPFKVSSGLYGLIGDKAKGGWGSVVDSLTLFAVVGGICTSLGFGVMQISGGMNYLWGVPSNQFVYAIIVGVMASIYTFSSYTGLDRGIAFLSKWNLNIYLYALAFVLIFGPTIHILETLSTSIGQYFQNIVGMSLYAEPMFKTGWVGNWSDFYYAWWLAFAPITGLFLIRLGYGRTIREYVMVNLVAPCIFAFIWFSFFGGSAIFFDHFKGAGIGQAIADKGNEVALFALFDQMPLSSFNNIIVLVMVALSFITNAHSTTSTVAAMTTKGFGSSRDNLEAPGSMKIFWGLAMGAAAWLALASGGTQGLQTTSVICGLPILVVLIIMSVGLVRWLTHQKDVDKVSRVTVDGEVIPGN